MTRVKARPSSRPMVNSLYEAWHTRPPIDDVRRFVRESWSAGVAEVRDEIGAVEGMPRLTTVRPSRSQQSVRDVPLTQRQELECASLPTSAAADARERAHIAWWQQSVQPTRIPLHMHMSLSDCWPLARDRHRCHRMGLTPKALRNHPTLARLDRDCCCVVPPSLIAAAAAAESGGSGT